MARKRRRRRPIAFLLLLMLVPSAKAYASGPLLRVAFRTDTPFYQFIDEKGDISGLHVDLMNAIARDNDIAIKYVPMSRLWDCVAALRKSEVDVVLGVPSSDGGDFLGSMETMTANICLMARTGFKAGKEDHAFANYVAAAEYNTANISLMSNLGASTYIVTGSQLGLLEAFLSGESDFMICDLNCMMYLLKRLKLEDQFVLLQKNIGTVGYVAAVKRGNVALLRLINDGLMRLRLSGEYERIRAKWIGEETDPFGRISRVIGMLLAIAAIVGMSFAIYVLTSARLKKILKEEIKEKTRELNLRVLQLQGESDLRNRIIERSPNGMVLFDRGNKVTLINSSACRIVNLPEPPLGKDVLELRLFGDILRQHESGGFAGEEQVSNRTYSSSDEYGFRKVYQYSILPIFEGNACASALITVEDITVDEEKKQAIIERGKNKTLNLMMASIAHEIKNPLTGILNFAKLIKTKRDDRQFLDFFSLLVPKEVDRISRLIDSMMQYARPPRGNPERMDLSMVAKECSYMAKATIKDPRILVSANLPKGLYIEADRDQINQVLINIFMNSIASMEKKLLHRDAKDALNLYVSTGTREEYVIIVIRDEGEGMSPETLQNCTEPFFTSKSAGTGLGLALSKQLIQENNGSLLIESQETVGTDIAIQFRRLMP